MSPTRARLAAGALLVVAGALLAVSTLVFWTPCATEGASSDLCLVRMDSWLSPPYLADPPDRLPGVTSLSAVASLLAPLAWLVVVLGTPVPRPLRVAAWVAAAQPLSLGLWTVVSTFTPWIDPELPVSRLWWVSGELVALGVGVALVVVRRGRRLLPVLFAATVFGPLHATADVALFHVSGLDWDVAPGTGLGAAATLLVCGAVTVLDARRADRGPQPTAADTGRQLTV